MTTPSDGPRQLRLCAWSDLGPSERSAVSRLEIAQEQLDFAGSTANAVDLASDSDEQHLVGLASLWGNDEVVGFLLLKRLSEAPEWVPTDAAAISALRIDHARQGQGMGTATMRLVPDWVRIQWPEVSRVVLAVDEPNVGAIAAYVKAGWLDDGTRIRGRVGWERRMTLCL